MRLLLQQHQLRSKMIAEWTVRTIRIPVHLIEGLLFANQPVERKRPMSTAVFPVLRVAKVRPYSRG